MKNIVDGFSKMSKSEKINWLVNHYLNSDTQKKSEIEKYWLDDEKMQNTLDGFSENVISNHILPFSIAPNFLINGKIFAIPMVIEESSVVAAASSASKFWLSRGGFKAEVISTTKVGHVHFRWTGNGDVFDIEGQSILQLILQDVKPLTSSMEGRGGGIKTISFKNLTEKIPNIYQIEVTFETCDSMGANFINTVLEQIAASLRIIFEEREYDTRYLGKLEVIMSILSNYTPECLVRAWVSCTIDELDPNMPHDITEHLAHRFKTAVDIARNDPYRAVTHNKGIFNGIDALVLATGNDFRAIEACGHAYAARDGQYRSLSTCTIFDDIFEFSLEVPIACGTVGGLTKLHPMSKTSLEILGQPSAQLLMQIMCTLGLAQNFAAVKSLVTTGIQKGHMKMHLSNILNHLGVDGSKADLVKAYFDNKTISFSAVKEYVNTLD
ncbi:MAG TPA: hydroxymethylglutaryl-CoA reductase, degradative [Saprospiraceae bacterium]|nr:hydroxymethylglutaryl-CoA reductase, degradative [Saprospiraceae bacterium]